MHPLYYCLNQNTLVSLGNSKVLAKSGHHRNAKSTKLNVHPESSGIQHSVTVQISTESAELEELREMKSDVERREKAQAAVLERQAKRLEELETLYKVSMVFSPATKSASPRAAR